MTASNRGSGRALRALGLAAALSAAGAAPAEAQHGPDVGPLAYHTYLYFDDDGRNQIEYLDGDGRAYLWYPGEERVIEGRWRAPPEGGVCFTYSTTPADGPLGMRADQWVCEGWDLQRADVLAKAADDVFDLRSGAPPFMLRIDDYFDDLDAVRAAASRR